MILVDCLTGRLRAQFGRVQIVQERPNPDSRADGHTVLQVRRDIGVNIGFCTTYQESSRKQFGIRRRRVRDCIKNSTGTWGIIRQRGKGKMMNRGTVR